MSTTLLYASTWVLAQVSPNPDARGPLELILDNNQLLFWGFMAIVIVVPTVASLWCKQRIRAWEIGLKHAMIERGMSADEIKTVLESGSSKSCPTSAADPRRYESGKNPVSQ
jgi:hypothetical protein